jgi:quercetin dioxygenase-like cupin family protein
MNENLPTKNSETCSMASTKQLTDKAPALPKYTIDVKDTSIQVFHLDKAGEGHPKHVHTYSHVTVVHHGKLKVTTEKNGSFEMTKDTKPLAFPLNQWHELEAMEDGTVFCNVFQRGKDAFIQL